MASEGAAPGRALLARTFEPGAVAPVGHARHCHRRRTDGRSSDAGAPGCRTTDSRRRSSDCGAECQQVDACFAHLRAACLEDARGPDRDGARWWLERAGTGVDRPRFDFATAAAITPRTGQRRGNFRSLGRRCLARIRCASRRAGQVTGPFSPSLRAGSSRRDARSWGTRVGRKVGRWRPPCGMALLGKLPSLGRGTDRTNSDAARASCLRDATVCGPVSI